MIINDCGIIWLQITHYDDRYDDNCAKLSIMGWNDYFQTQVRTKDEAPTAPTSLEVSGFNQVKDKGKTKTNKHIIVYMAKVATLTIDVPTPWST